MKTILNLSLVLMLGLFTNQAMAQCNAAFTSNSSASPTISFTNMSTPPVSSSIIIYSSWNFGDGATSVSGATHPSHIYSAPGTYSVRLITTVYDSLTFAFMCTDTVINNVVVGQTNTLPCEALFTMRRDTFNFNQTSLSCVFDSYASYAGGGSITSYAWDFGDGSTSNIAHPNHTYAAGGQYNVCLTITTSNNCTDNYCLLVNVQPIAINQFAAYITGTVVPTPTIGATVYLIEYDAVTQSLFAIGSQTTGSWGPQQGYFSFSNIASGTYLVKAAYHSYDPAYATHLPTYYTSNALWSGATNVTTSPTTPQNITINMLAGTPTNGPGFIGGSVLTGANKTLGTGDPKHKLTALLFDVTNNEFVAMSRTDINGDYSFNGIAVGTYKVFLEELGKTMTAADITITASNANFPNVDFESNSTENHPATPTSTSSIQKELDIYSLKTNPVNNHFEIMGLTGGETVKILDLNGKVMKTFSAQNSFSVADLSAGIYLLNIQNNGLFKNMKLVIAK